MMPTRPVLWIVLSLAAMARLPAAEQPEALNMADYLQGRAIYQTQCAPCHGRTGRGDGDWAEGVEVKPRNFRSGIFKFRTTPPGFLPTQEDLERTLRTGVSGTMMPTFAKLSDSDLEAVLTYIKGFSPRWKDAANYAEPIELPKPPDWWVDRDKRKRHAQKAAVIFAQTCTPCHGEKGKGDGPAAATLIDVWEHPIRPADLAGPTYKSGDRPQDLYRTIAMGLDGTPMASFQELLTPKQIWDLVAFIDLLGEE